MVNKVFLGILTLIGMMIIMTGIFELLNTPNSIANISGLLLTLGLIFGSIKMFQFINKKK